MNISRIDEHRLGPEDNRLLYAWHNNELDDIAAHRLEKRFFFEPELAEAASIDQDIREGMQLLDHQHAREHRRERLLTLVAAASIGALAVLVPVSFQHSAPSQAPIMGNVEWVRLDHVRGQSDLHPMINPSASTDSIVIEIPAPLGVGPYQASIIADGRSASAPLLAVDELHAVDGALTLVLPRTALAKGDYRIQLRNAASPGTPLASYPFRFQP